MQKTNLHRQIVLALISIMILAVGCRSHLFVRGAAIELTAISPQSSIARANAETSSGEGLSRDFPYGNAYDQHTLIFCDCGPVS